MSLADTIQGIGMCHFVYIEGQMVYGIAVINRLMLDIHMIGAMRQVRLDAIKGCRVISLTIRGVLNSSDIVPNSSFLEFMMIPD